jgi:chromosome segregation ATPase
MNGYENSSDASVQEKGKWFTYGGKVDENLMSMLKEAQKTAGIKKFADFMNDMLKIYRENKHETEPPQMQIIKKSVADIITSTESMLQAMQIIEDDKFKAIAEYQQRAQDAEESVLAAEEKISELVDQLANSKKELASSQIDIRSVKTELTAEIERGKKIESMINRIQQIADDALLQKDRAVVEQHNALELVTELRSRTSELEAENYDLKVRIEMVTKENNRLQEDVKKANATERALSESLQRETIARNRFEERLQVLEPQLQKNYERLEVLQDEINTLRLSEQTLIQKVLFLENEISHVKSKTAEI